MTVGGNIKELLMCSSPSQRVSSSHSSANKQTVTMKDDWRCVVESFIHMLGLRSLMIWIMGLACTCRRRTHAINHKEIQSYVQRPRVLSVKWLCLIAPSCALWCPANQNSWLHFRCHWKCVCKAELSHFCSAGHWSPVALMLPSVPVL